MGEVHADDLAVDAFAALMKKKLAKKRTAGYEGWQTCAPFDLAKMLVEHLEKGDPVDIANFAMFLGSIDAYRGSIRVALRLALSEWVADNSVAKVLYED